MPKSKKAIKKKYAPKYVDTVVRRPCCGMMRPFPPPRETNVVNLPHYEGCRRG